MTVVQPARGRAIAPRLLNTVQTFAQGRKTRAVFRGRSNHRRHAEGAGAATDEAGATAAISLRTDGVGGRGADSRVLEVEREVGQAALARAVAVARSRLPRARSGLIRMQNAGEPAIPTHRYIEHGLRW